MEIIMDNHDKDEWGNIPLPGLTDEELFNTNWNYVAAARERIRNPIWQAKQLHEARTRKERLGETYSKKMSESQKKRYLNLSDEEKLAHSQRCKEIWNDPEYVKRMREYYDNPEYRVEHQKRVKEIANRPEMLEWYKEFNRAKRQDPNHIIKHNEGVKHRSEHNEDWIRKNCRPVQCPLGIFKKAKDMMDEYHKIYGGKRESVAVKLRTWLKSDKKLDWKYLTWDEYDTLIK